MNTTNELSDAELEAVVAGKGLVKEVDVRFGERRVVRSVWQRVGVGQGGCPGGVCPKK
jgi:hypothetical protein